MTTKTNSDAGTFESGSDSEGPPPPLKGFLSKQKQITAHRANTNENVDQTADENTSLDLPALDIITTDLLYVLSTINVLRVV